MALGSNINVVVNLTPASTSPLVVMAGRSGYAVTLVGCSLVAGSPGNANWPDTSASEVSFTDSAGNLLYGPVPLRDAAPFVLPPALPTEHSNGGWFSGASGADLHLNFGGVINGTIQARYDVL